MASQRNLRWPQVQVEARGPRQVTPTHGAALSGTRGRRIKGALAAVVGGTVRGCDGASYLAVAPCRHRPGGVTHQFTRRPAQH